MININLTRNKETTSQQVELKDDDVHIVERMLHFFYAASYPAILPGPHTDMSLRSELDVHVEMYAIADKYQVAALSVLAKDNYQHVVNGYDDCIAVLRSVPKIYNSTIKTDRGLRDIAVAEVIAKVVNKMEGRQMSSGKRSEVVPLLESVVSDVPGFALDILTKVGKVIRDQVEKATRDQIETAIRERGDCYCECKYYQDCNEQY